MIKLKDILSEAYKHPLYGSDKVHFFVKKPFYVYIASKESEPTGNYSTPGPGVEYWPVGSDAVPLI